MEIGDTSKYWTDGVDLAVVCLYCMVGSSIYVILPNTTAISASQLSCMIAVRGSLSSKRQLVMKTTPQAAEFLKLYQNQIPEDSRRMLRAFATLPRQNFVLRRYHIIRL